MQCVSAIPNEWVVIFVLLAIWELAWKGIALWRASKNNDKAWYVIILVINSVGILPIIYLLLPHTRKKN